MKAKTFLSIAALVTGLQFAPASLAQTRDEEGNGRRGRHMRMLANLSADERAKLRVAHHQAMADPAVQAAKDRQRQATREFRELKRARMLQADPTIQPILEKMPARGRGDR